MKNNFLTVLSDFHIAPLTLVPQNDSCALLMKGMVKAIAIKKGKSSDKDIEKIERAVKMKFKLFALSSEIAKQRHLVVWPENYKYDDKFKIIENGKYVKHDFAIPMYSDLAKNHTNPDGDGLDKRMDLFRSITEKNIYKLYECERIERPDQIIHVTSSGYIEPNPVDVIVSGKKWFDVYVTNFYNKACNATISAIETAHASMRSSLIGDCEKLKKRIDVVHTELFSLHMKLSHDDPVNIGLISSYSDSILRYSIFPYAEVRQRGLPGLKILSFRHILVPDSIHFAVLKVSSPAFDYFINPIKYFKAVKDNVRDFVTGYFKEIGVDFKTIKNEILFLVQASSIHILMQIGAELGLSEEQLTFSRNNLYENGYLTSSAIPFMCKKVIESSEIPSGQKVFCLGYALGMTISGMLLEKI
jgi:alkylresorcinol/alkylpyrone synthase